MSFDDNKRWAVLFLAFSLPWMGTAQAGATDVSRTGGPDAIYFYASQSGKRALDRGSEGGNPFASAFVESLSGHGVTLGEFSTALLDLTAEKSRGFQRPDASAATISDVLRLCSLQILPKPMGQKRVALVLVFSDYSGANLSSLPGARGDLRRVAAALQRAGFDVVTVLDPGHGEMEGALREFGERSKASDMAVLYTAGHGIEVEGDIYLIPGNYPFLRKTTMLDKRTVPLARLGAALQARRANLVFYGASRDNPFGAE
uniref:Caspase domain-containing protein n=1 Tax=Candidatus Kentrum sp. LFY TaxID=2126342 RepID=A0A450UWZ8_9GAMM|nr:MAG: Caspase domain-containing protein [Candidatus Kentron sp. LFY]